MAGLTLVLHAGQVILCNLEGKPLFALSPDAAEYLAKELINGACELRTGKRPLPNGPAIKVEIGGDE